MNIIVTLPGDGAYVNQREITDKKVPSAFSNFSETCILGRDNTLHARLKLQNLN